MALLTLLLAHAEPFDRTLAKTRQTNCSPGSVSTHRALATLGTKKELFVPEPSSNFTSEVLPSRAAEVSTIK